MKVDVIKKPKRCPRCGGNVYRILYGEPCCSEKEYFEQYGEHVIFGGCCVYDGQPDYECEDCGMQFRKLDFPANAKALAKEAAIKEMEIFCDVKYEGLHRKQMVFSPVAKEGICWDGVTLFYVNQKGKVKVSNSTLNMLVLARLDKQKQAEKEHNEKFYWYAAKRAISDEDSYYKTVHKCGWFRGKRAYEPILKDKYREHPPIIGLPLVILVDSKGRAEYVRDVLSFNIYNEIRKKNKKG